MEHIPGKIFLSEQRGVLESPSGKSVMTFNAGSYYNEHKHPFSSLVLFNDEVLSGGKQLPLILTSPSHLIILPVTGDLYFDGLWGDAGEVNVGEVKINSGLPEKEFLVTNPYPSDEVSFFQIRILDESIPENVSWPSLSFDLAASRNRLIEIPVGVQEGQQNTFRLSIGQFDGRAEAFYSLFASKNEVFLFVISGAFEVEGRLLHPRDGLALWNTKSIEIEALSNHATLLILELLKT
ncbi:hypothetical protein DBR11_25155 [Pedobacter sp. HMWF019]|uniref:pirin family protein n=1 Tax=Pedobacter sp. HMWF019 TaxID=2056856 RepID=UPI000D39A2A4|nr:hypothetical protein [Pedobacter sp. HMWF019]PTS93571.1 hypothetical protein DBR11_25155 [Pedobacter sp. HMWF019]